MVTRAVVEKNNNIDEYCQKTGSKKTTTSHTIYA